MNKSDAMILAFRSMSTLLAFGAPFLAPASLSSPLSAQNPPPEHLESVSIQVLREHDNNRLDAPIPYALEIYVTGDLSAVTVTPPGGSPVALVQSFGWQLPESIDSATPPQGDFLFAFTTASGTDNVTLNYQAVSLETSGFAKVIWPRPNDRYTPVEPKLEWQLSSPSAGAYIKAEVENEATGQLVGPVFLGIGETVWEPGVELDPGAPHTLTIDVYNDASTARSTAAGDDFLYDTKFSDSNYVCFTTCACVQSLPPIPVTAPVEGFAGTPVIGQIQTMSDAGLPTCGSGPMAARPDSVIATFVFAPGFEFLDRCYDFRWVSVRDDFLLDGLPAEYTQFGKKIPCPSIDPIPGQIIGHRLIGDTLPYYWNELCWSASDTLWPHREGLGSQFADALDRAIDEALRFRTFLVVQDRSAGTFGPREFRVLQGFSWIHEGESDDPVFCAAIAPNESLITRAMDNSPQIPFQSRWLWREHAFSGWRATASGPPLRACP